ncbi:maleylpyruvate isomerase N-terminal domain-containing protein, partial [Streptomyces sp. NPDC012438]
MAEPHVSETRKALERAIHAERLALAQDLTELSEAQWAKASLCERWTVEEVVAHLTAGASTGMWRWLLSMLAARFDPDL